MLSRLLALAIAGLLLPTASASQPQPEPLAAGRAVASDLVWITVSVGDDRTGELLPICEDAEPLQEGARVVGVLQNDCIQPLQTQSGLPICEPVQGTILPEEGPPVTVEPNQGCIDSIRDRIQGLVPDEDGPLHIHLDIRPQVP